MRRVRLPWPVERHVGVLEQPIGIAAVVRRDGDADADASDDLMAMDVEGFTDLLDQTGRKRGGADRLVAADLHDREFVAAEPCHGIGRAHAGAQAVGDRL